MDRWIAGRGVVPGTNVEDPDLPVSRSSYTMEKALDSHTMATQGVNSITFARNRVAFGC